MLRRLSSFIGVNWSGYTIPTEPNIQLDILTEQHADEAIEVLASMFSTALSEPILAQFGIPATGDGSITEYLRLNFDLKLDEGLSVAAFDSDQSDKVVGVMFSEDFEYFLKDEPMPNPLKDFIDQHEQWQVVYDIIGILENHYREHCKRQKTTKSVHLFWGAVHPEVLGKGILCHIISQTGEIARERGYDTLFGECTNVFSHQVFECANAKTLMRIKYENYLYKDGSKPFEGANAKAEQWLMENGMFDRSKYSGCTDYIRLDEIVL